MSDQEFNEGHISEAMDRVNIIIVMINELLDNHPAILKTNLQNDIDMAANRLCEVYQKLGSYEVERA